MSSQFQRKIFDENDYLAKLNPENKPIKNLENFFAGFSKSIILETEKEKKGEKANYEKPISVSLEGNDAQVISSFLNELASAADKETVNEFLNIIRQKINIRLDEISKQRGLLLSRAKQDRLAKIERIKIEDRQKINEINDQITRLRIKAKKDRLNDIEKIEKSNNVKIEKIDEKIKRLRLKTKNNRLNLIAKKEDENALKIKKINEKINLLRTKAKKDRLNKIQILSDAASIAAELGIIENNFKKISNNKFNNSDLTIAIGDNQKLPQWYLYGEKALLKEMQTLENRKNDDPYIPEIVNLQNQINTIKNDKDLLALKNRENDDPYISEIVTLKNEIDNIENDKDLLALKNRSSDDPYIPEIVNLQNKLNSIKSNQTLKTLKSRKDDSPFVAEINKLDIEVIKLKSFRLDATGINAMQINQQAFPPESSIKPKKKLIVAVAFIAGFILSIFLVFIMNAFRKEDDKVAA